MKNPLQYQTLQKQYRTTSVLRYKHDCVSAGIGHASTNPKIFAKMKCLMHFAF